MLSAGRHQLIDVGHHHGLVHRAHPAVVDDRHRAVPAAVRAAPARLHRADQPLLVADRQTGVAVEGRQPVANRKSGRSPGQLDDRAGLAAVDPGQEAGFILAGDHRVGRGSDGEVSAHRGVEAVEAQGELGSPGPDRVGHLEGQSHGGVHRHRERHSIRPVELGHRDRSTATSTHRTW